MARAQVGRRRPPGRGRRRPGHLGGRSPRRKEAADTRATAPTATEATPEPEPTAAAPPGDLAPPAEPAEAAAAPPPPPAKSAPAKRESAKRRSHTTLERLDKDVNGLGLGNEIGGRAAGLGEVGTIVSGSGKGGGLGGKDVGAKKSAPTATAGKTTSVGKLDTEIINRVIRQHRSQIRYCYQQALAKNPGLAGKIIIDFVIDPTGKVANATAKGDSAMVEAMGSCASRAFRSFRFPAPEGGGTAKVSYPLIFAQK